MISRLIHEWRNRDAIQTLYFQCYMERGSKRRASMVSHSNWVLQANRTVRP